MMIEGTISITGRAWTRDGVIDWRDSVAADSISAAVRMSESNLRVRYGDVRAHFTELRAAADQPTPAPEPIRIEGKRA